MIWNPFINCWLASKLIERNVAVILTKDLGVALAGVANYNCRLSRGAISVEFEINNYFLNIPASARC